MLCQTLIKLLFVLYVFVCKTVIAHHYPKPTFTTTAQQPSTSYSSRPTGFLQATPTWQILKLKNKIAKQQETMAAQEVDIGHLEDKINSLEQGNKFLEIILREIKVPDAVLVEWTNIRESHLEDKDNIEAGRQGHRNTAHGKTNDNRPTASYP
jgi:hypothetical protein